MRVLAAAPVTSMPGRVRAVSPGERFIVVPSTLGSLGRCLSGDGMLAASGGSPSRCQGAA